MAEYLEGVKLAESLGKSIESTIIRVEIARSHPYYGALFKNFAIFLDGFYDYYELYKTRRNK